MAENNEASPTVRKQIKTNSEVEKEEGPRVEETDQGVEISHKNAILETVVKKDEVFRRQWERATSITQIICRDPLQIDIGSRMDQHKTKNMRLICEIVVVAIAFTTSLQWTLGKISQRVVFDPGGASAKVTC